MLSPSEHTWMIHQVFCWLVGANQRNDRAQTASSALSARLEITGWAAVCFLIVLILHEGPSWDSRGIWVLIKVMDFLGIKVN